MKNVAIEIRNRTFFERLIFRKTYKRDLAETWDEVPMKSRLSYLRNKYEKNATYAKANLAYELLKIPHRVFMRFSDVQIAQLIDELQFVENAHDARVKLKAKNGFYTPIAPSLADLRAIEFALMHDALLEISGKNGEKSEDALFQLAACISRKNEIGIDSHMALHNRVEEMKTLPAWYVMMLCEIGILVHKNVYETYKNILFDDAENTESDGTEGLPDLRWWGLFLQIAEKGVFGNYDSVLANNFQEIAMFLIEKKKEGLRAKKMIDDLQQGNSSEL